MIKTTKGSGNSGDYWEERSMPGKVTMETAKGNGGETKTLSRGLSVLLKDPHMHA